MSSALFALGHLVVVPSPQRLAVFFPALVFGWMAFPFTAYTMNSGSNDAIMPAILIWGFWLCSSPVARGASTALAGWTKFASLLLVPLWLTYPNGLRPRAMLRFALAFVVATATAFSILSSSRAHPCRCTSSSTARSPFSSTAIRRFALTTAKNTPGGSRFRPPQLILQTLASAPSR